MNNKFSFNTKKMERTDTINSLNYFIKIWKSSEKQISRNHDLPANICIQNEHIVEICWFKKGCSHREKDNPATINLNGSKEWSKEGTDFDRGRIQNRFLLPIYICSDGTKEFYEENEEGE